MLIVGDGEGWGQGPKREPHLQEWDHMRGIRAAYPGNTLRETHPCTHPSSLSPTCSSIHSFIYSFTCPSECCEESMKIHLLICEFIMTFPRLCSWARGRGREPRVFGYCFLCWMLELIWRCVSLKSLLLWNSGCHLAKTSQQQVTGQDVNSGMSDTKSHVIKNLAVWLPQYEVLGITE